MQIVVFGFAAEKLHMAFNCAKSSLVGEDIFGISICNCSVGGFSGFVISRSTSGRKLVVRCIPFWLLAGSSGVFRSWCFGMSVSGSGSHFKMSAHTPGVSRVGLFGDFPH